MSENRKLANQISYLENQIDGVEKESINSLHNNTNSNSLGTEIDHSELDIVESTTSPVLISNEIIVRDNYILRRDTIIINQSTPVYKKYDIGNVVVNVPDTNMKVGFPYIIKLRISKKELGLENLIGDSTNYINTNDIKSSIILDRINISPIMSAYLIDIDNAFEIKSGFVSNMKNIESGGYVEWEWKIKPIKSGENRLKVIANVINDETNQPTEISVYDKQIKIKSNWKFLLTKFLSNNWEWSWGTLLIPLLTFIYNKFKNKKPTQIE
tara:strand:- start:2187 stop:2993 length:807 start_codon:yes stop_codon:yes gene_type:complete